MHGIFYMNSVYINVIYLGRICQPRLVMIAYASLGTCLTIAVMFFMLSSDEGNHDVLGPDEGNHDGLSSNEGGGEVSKALDENWADEIKWLKNVISIIIVLITTINHYIIHER